MVAVTVCDLTLPPALATVNLVASYGCVYDCYSWQYNNLFVRLYLNRLWFKVWNFKAFETMLANQSVMAYLCVI